MALFFRVNDAPERRVLQALIVLLSGAVLTLPLAAHAENTSSKTSAKSAELDKKAAALRKEEEQLLSSLGMQKENVKGSVSAVKSAVSKAVITSEQNSTSARASLKSEVPAKKEPVIRRIEPKLEEAPARSELDLGPPRHAGDTIVKLGTPRQTKIQTITRVPNDDEIRALIRSEEQHLATDLRSLEHSITTLRKSNDTTFSELKSEDTKLASRIESLETRVKGGKDAERQFDKAAAAIRGEYDDLKAVLDQYKKSLDVARISDTQIRKRQDEQDSNLSRIDTEIGAVRDRIDHMQSNLDELSSRFEENLKTQRLVVNEAPEFSDSEYTWSAPPTYGKLGHNAVTSDMAIVTTIEDGTELWSGPEETDKVIGTYPRGAQLAVEVARDDWYRVITPQGTRAWVPARSVMFNDDRSGSALQIQGSSGNW